MTNVGAEARGGRIINGTTAKEVMDIRGVAAYLGMGKSKIYGLIRERKIPASRIGRQYRFSKAIIDAWLRDSVITGPAGAASATDEPVDRR